MSRHRKPWTVLKTHIDKDMQDFKKPGQGRHAQQPAKDAK